MGKLTEAILQVYGKTLLTKPMPRVEIKLDPPVCTNCNNVLAHNSFHDCFGHYDEVRYIIGETSSPRSMIKRLHKKYGNDIYNGVYEYANSNPTEAAEKTARYVEIRGKFGAKGMTHDTTWEEEEQLWAS